MGAKAYVGIRRMLGSGVWVLLLFVVSGRYAFVTGSDVVKAGLTLGA